MRKLICGLFLIAVAGLCLPASTAQTFLGKDAGAWEKILNESKDARQRRNAAFSLGKLGSAAASALPSLKKHLKDDDAKEVREAAAFALGEIGKESLKTLDDPTLVDALAAALKDTDSLVRRSAAYALGNFGSSAKSALGALEATLANEPTPAVRQNIAWAMGRIGPETITSLKTALRDADPAVQRDAANSVGLFKKDIDVARKALPELVACCKVKNSQVRFAALNVLIKIIDERDTKAAGSIAEALDDQDLEVRQNAAFALSYVGGKESTRAIPVLMDALKQRTNKELRGQAAIAIYNFGPDAHEAVPSLIQTLADDDQDLHKDVALALGGIGPRAEAAVPALVKLLADPKEKDDSRVEAAKALAKIGPVPAAVQAMKTIVGVLEDRRNDTKIRERVIWALRPHYQKNREVHLPGVMDAFINILSEPKEDKSRMLRYDCAYMLGVLKEKNAPDKALDTLHEFLHDSTIVLYRGARGDPGSTGFEVNKGVANVKEEGKGDGRVMAVQALMAIGYARISKRDDIMKQLKAIAANPETLPDLFVKTIEAFRYFRAESGVPRAEVTKRLRAIAADPNTDAKLKEDAEKLLR